MSLIYLASHCPECIFKNMVCACFSIFARSWTEGASWSTWLWYDTPTVNGNRTTYRGEQSHYTHIHSKTKDILHLVLASTRVWTVPNQLQPYQPLSGGRACKPSLSLVVANCPLGESPRAKYHICTVAKQQSVLGDHVLNLCNCEVIENACSMSKCPNLCLN